jgi:hypothetical protein
MYLPTPSNPVSAVATPSMPESLIEVARSNFQMWSRLALTFTDGLVQLGKVHTMAVETALHDETVEDRMGETFRPTLLSRWPSYALNYSADVMATMSAIATDLVTTISAPAKASQSSVLVTAGGGSSLVEEGAEAGVDGPRASVILDAQGAIVKRIES